MAIVISKFKMVLYIHNDWISWISTQITEPVWGEIDHSLFGTLFDAVLFLFHVFVENVVCIILLDFDITHIPKVPLYSWSPDWYDVCFQRFFFLRTSHIWAGESKLGPIKCLLAHNYVGNILMRTTCSILSTLPHSKSKNNLAINHNSDNNK